MFWTWICKLRSTTFVLCVVIVPRPTTPSPVSQRPCGNHKGSGGCDVVLWSRYRLLNTDIKAQIPSRLMDKYFRTLTELPLPMDSLNGFATPVWRPSIPNAMQSTNRRDQSVIHFSRMTKRVTRHATSKQEHNRRHDVIAGMVTRPTLGRRLDEGTPGEHMLSHCMDALLKAWNYSGRMSRGSQVHATAPFNEVINDLLTVPECPHKSHPFCRHRECTPEASWIANVLHWHGVPSNHTFYADSQALSPPTRIALCG